VCDLVRVRYYTMAAETPGGEWKWRVVEVIEQGFKETLATRLTLNVPPLRRKTICRSSDANFTLRAMAAFALRQMAAA
jgi:hypothetical protein